MHILEGVWGWRCFPGRLHFGCILALSHFLLLPVFCWLGQLPASQSDSCVAASGLWECVRSTDSLAWVDMTLLLGPPSTGIKLFLSAGAEPVS